MSVLVVGAFGYHLTAFLFALVALLSLLSWNGNRSGGLFLLGCAVSSVWAEVSAFRPASINLDVSLIYFSEIARLGAWALFLSSLASKAGIAKSVRFVSSATFTVLLALGLYAAAEASAADLLPNIFQTLVIGGLILILSCMVLLEQLFRNSNREAKSSFKILVVGLGGTLILDLFLYTQAVLNFDFGDTTWAIRGVVQAALVPFFALSARRNTQWDLDIYVSRQVVFYTTIVFATGVYFVLVALGGYLIQFYKGELNRALYLLFILGALFIYILLFTSTTLRYELRVFLSKHFFRNKYDYRSEWLKLVAKLSESEDVTSPEVLIGSLARIVGSPSGVAWITDESQTKLVEIAQYNRRTGVGDIDLSEPIVEFILEREWVVDLREYRQNPDVYENRPIPPTLEKTSGAWLLIPLFSGKSLLGVVLLIDSSDTRRHLNYEDRDLLKTVANHLSVHLAQQMSDELLAQSKQFDAFNKITAFLVHDLSNLVAQQSLILENAKVHRNNPDFIDDSLRTIQGSVERMNKVLEQIQRPDKRSNNQVTQLRFLLSTAADRCGDRRPVPSVSYENADTDISVDVRRFVSVLVNLIRNAQDACDVNGNVAIAGSVNDAEVVIKVTDSGVGMTEEFIRNRLFKPFYTSKGSQGMGIGVYQAREFSRSMGGELVARSSPGEGSELIITLPRRNLGSGFESDKLVER